SSAPENNSSVEAGSNEGDAESGTLNPKHNNANSEVNKSPDVSEKVARPVGRTQTETESRLGSTPERKNAKPSGSTKITGGESIAASGKPEGEYVPPALVKGAKSLSPPEALQGYVSGNVTMDALVDETGHVKSATVISGRPELH